MVRMLVFDETAKASGRSRTAVARDAARGNAIAGKAGKVRGTSLDKGTELDALAKLPEPERDALIDRAEAGDEGGDAGVNERCYATSSLLFRRPQPRGGEPLHQFWTDAGLVQGRTKHLTSRSEDMEDRPSLLASCRDLEPTYPQRPFMVPHPHRGLPS